MTEEPDNIVLEILRRQQDGQSRLAKDVRLGLQQTNERLAAIEHHMAGFHVSISRFNDDVDGLKARVGRIEQRLELADHDPDAGGSE